MSMKHPKKIKQKLHHWFIPSRANNHHPHIIRLPGLLLVVSLIIVVQIAFNLIATGRFSVLGLSSAIDENSIVKLTNRERAKAGLSPLNPNSQLNNAAKQKAYDMLSKNYWAHYAPDGTSPWYFFEKNGYKYNFAGENLARNFSTSSGVLAGWMASQGHKDNLLNPKYSDIGIAVVEGKMDGKDTTLVVSLYAQPADSASIAHASSANGLDQQSLSNSNVAGTQVSNSQRAPEEKIFGLFTPILAIDRTLSWGAKIIALILLVLATIYINTHRVRTKIKTSHHPLSTIIPTFCLIIAIILLIISSFGSVG